MPALDLLVSRLQTWTGLDLERGSARRALERHLAARIGPDEAARQRHIAELTSADHPDAIELIDAVTVCHSWLFRDPEQLDAIATLLHAAPARPACLWVPACAAGEDAFSLALTGAATGLPLAIHATDINTRALAQAAEARYGAWSVRSVPAELAPFLAQRDGGLFEIAPAARASVAFARHNLLDPPPIAPGARGWDVILCRNVLMYMTRTRATDLLARLGSALAPGGHLFLGANDIFSSAPAPLELVRVGRRHALRRSHAGAPPPPPPPKPRSPAPPMPRPPAQQATPQGTPEPKAPSSAPRAIVAALAAIEQDDGAAALELLDQLLDTDPLHVEAHLLAGIAHHLGDNPLDAARCLRAALVLCPTLWPAELYLSLSLRRLGDSAAADRALERAARLAAASSQLPDTPHLAPWLGAWRRDIMLAARAP